MAATERRVLIVVSDDFGELSNAVWLLLGSRFLAELLVPERMRAINEDVLPIPAQSYASAEDVIAAAERLRPEVVFLLSGYLYAVNGIFDAASLQRLIAGLQALGCCVATSDPFLGLMAPGPAVQPRDLTQQRLVDTVRTAGDALGALWHVYPVMPQGDCPQRRIAYFNPRMQVTAADRAAMRSGLTLHLPLDGQRPHWLFVLASQDHLAQISTLGADAFHAMLAQRLYDAQRSGRQAVLVAPQACMDALRAYEREIDGALLLPFCSHGTFLGLLLTAEHAFYWNVLANSVPSRLLNDLPVFFFDTGHMVHALPELLEPALTSYYPNARLPLIDLDKPMTAEGLLPHARDELASMADAVRLLRAGPDPERMVETLLAGQ
jgi:hypothetical protein